MLRSFNTIKNGLTGIMDVNDAISNNMANVNTTGFKQTKVLFKDVQEVEILKLKGKDEIDPQAKGSVAGTLSLGPEVDKYCIDFSQGDLVTTGGTLDLALNGDGFFQLEDNEGNHFYTRNGNFTLNNESYLTTTDGKYVLNQQGSRIFLDTQTIDGEGLIVTNDGHITYGQQRLDTIGIIDFENKDTLAPRDGTLFENIDKKNQGNIPENINIVQGALESSNANSVKTMIKSIEALRTYESMTNSLKMSNETLQQAISRVGRVG